MVRRYNLDTNSLTGVVEHPEGDYVTARDYDVLNAKLREIGAMCSGELGCRGYEYRPVCQHDTQLPECTITFTDGDLACATCTECRGVWFSIDTALRPDAPLSGAMFRCPICGNMGYPSAIGPVCCTDCANNGRANASR